jgi:hypothetical protein
MASLNFSYTESDLPKGYEILPAGNYTAQIIKSEIKQNKNGNGTRLSLCFQIVDGDFTGRTIFHDVTLSNDNPTAEKIGREQLASLCAAVGKNNVHDSGELHDTPLQIRLGIKKDPSGQYEDRNVISRFEASAMARPAVAKAFTPPSGASASAARPWERKGA